MKYPKLVPPRLCTAGVKVQFLGNLDIEGNEEILCEFSGKCNLQYKTKQVYTTDKRLITIAATALFDGDIAPDILYPKGTLFLKDLFSLDCENGAQLETESGETLEMFAIGKEYRIHRITKERNPDGSVNYTRLELIE